jgi:hypothetical protein
MCLLFYIANMYEIIVIAFYDFSESNVLAYT